MAKFILRELKTSVTCAPAEMGYVYVESQFQSLYLHRYVKTREVFIFISLSSDQFSEKDNF